MVFIIILTVVILNVLTNHTMLTRKKPVSYCILIFICNSIFVIGCLFILKKVVTNPLIYTYVLYSIGFSYIGYIHLVFRESISKKLFSMFSVWVFSTIIISVSNFSFNIIGDQLITLPIANIIRISLQLLFLGISYKLFGSYFKKTLNMVNDRIPCLMTAYMFLALILLVTGFSWNNNALNNNTIIPEKMLLITFIVLGYIIVFLGISSTSENALLRANMNKVKKQSESNYLLANYDYLTGLATRQNIFNRISKTVEEHAFQKKQFAHIIFDIDKFKSINDCYGHLIGDSVSDILPPLIEVGASCSSSLTATA